MLEFCLTLALIKTCHLIVRLPRRRQVTPTKFTLQRLLRVIVWNLTNLSVQIGLAQLTTVIAKCAQLGHIYPQSFVLSFKSLPSICLFISTGR